MHYLEYLELVKMNDERRDLATAVKILREVYDRGGGGASAGYFSRDRWVENFIFSPYLLQSDEDRALLETLPKMNFEEVYYRPHSVEFVLYHVTERLRRYDYLGRPFDLGLMEGSGGRWAKTLLKECWAHGVSKWELEAWRRLQFPFSTMEDVVEMDEILPAEKFNVFGDDWQHLDKFIMEQRLTINGLIDARTEFVKRTRPTKSARKIC